ncbi:GIY-YIG nuclease family protein [Streptomyces sp. NPDC006640]|uniref:GIY-YIG nuclease family protein n=1 Tax=Streptomyces sp. NPDC006640 TaxID=3364754 RepID=UPI0036B44791
MAEAIGVSPRVASDAVRQLAEAGWIATDSSGWHLVCPPPPQRRGGFNGEARESFTAPVAIEASPPRLPLPVTSATRARPSAWEEPRRQRAKAASTYLIGIEGLPLVKIGHTTLSPKARMSNLQTGQPLQLSLLWSCEFDYEAELHVHFDAYRVRGEWFDLTSLGDPVNVVEAAVGEIEASRA